jgi:hypothetical protein
VRRVLPFQAILLMLAGLLVTSGGCGIYNPRHGMILRGDWSLEMNRVPWLNSRTKSYDEVGEGGCGQGMVVQPPMSAGGCADVSGAAIARPAQPVAHRCPPGPMICRTCTGTGAAAPTTPPPQQMAQSRFHPVPTRPVFTPWNCRPADSRTRVPQRPRPPQEQPQRELIPTPAASQAHMEPTLAGSPVTNAAWIFQPEGVAGHALAGR